MSLRIAKQIAELLALALYAASAYAGTYLESTRISLQNPKTPPQVARLWVDGKRMRTQTEANGRYLIFKEDALYAVDPANKSYMVMDRAALAQLSGRVAEARTQLQSRLATLPPEQRAKIEKLMGSAAGGEAPPPLAQSVQQTSRTDSAAGISCTVWEVSEANVKVRELCVAPAVPGVADLMAIMKTFVASIKQVTSSFGSIASNDLFSFPAIDGVPLITRTFAGGVATEESKLTSIRSESIPASTFEVPADYTSRAMFPMPNGAP
jgi:hypothetical protein